MTPLAALHVIEALTYRVKGMSREERLVQIRNIAAQAIYEARPFMYDYIEGGLYRRWSPDAAGSGDGATGTPIIIAPKDHNR